MSIVDYFNTNKDAIIWLAHGRFFRFTREKVVLKMDNGNMMVSDDEDMLIEFYYKNSGATFRVCSFCGKPFDSGYVMDAWLDGYACSDECRDAIFNSRYKNGWKTVDELEPEESEKLAREYDESDEFYYCYYEGKGNGKFLCPDYTYYTEWD